ncbi:MAG: ActS/PrrB/RegB family redox-sensitive histidine kinase [Hyphomicrobium sp.]
MVFKAFYSKARNAGSAESQLRLQTIVRLRWLGIIGQLGVICVVRLLLQFRFPFGWCLLLIASSAWLNVFLALRFPARHRLTTKFATLLLAFDIAELATLLFLTGGIENPFTTLMVVPVTVSAATLPARNTIALGLLASIFTIGLAGSNYPLPWYNSVILDHPPLYDVGAICGAVGTMIFIALYVERLTRESKLMSDALAATELVLAREQKLHALDGLAAAAAHELGTPLSTIVLVTKEIKSSIPLDSPLLEDVELLHQQSLRCRDILKKLTTRPSEQDPLHATISLQQMLEEVTRHHLSEQKIVQIFVHPKSDIPQVAQEQPLAARRPGVLFGIGNILENAIDFAKKRVDLIGEWDASNVIVTISDDGPGFKPEIIDTIGEPYVTSRSAKNRKHSGKAGGMGLGFFIAKTLLERSGARLALENKQLPQVGAIVRISWPRIAFEEGAERPGPGSVLPKSKVWPISSSTYDR